MYYLNSRRQEIMYAIENDEYYWGLENFKYY